VNQGYKPPAYASVSAYVVARHAQRVIDFLRQTFDAEEARRFDKPDGSIMHAEVRIDDSIVMIADGSDDVPAFPIWFHVYVPDVDATYQRALKAGGASVQEPTQKDDPDRQHLVDRDAGRLNGDHTDGAAGGSSKGSLCGGRTHWDRRLPASTRSRSSTFGGSGRG